MSSALDTLRDLLTHLIDPWLFMSISARHIPSTVANLVASRQWGTLLIPWRFTDALFGNFWATIGPQVKTSAEQRVVPLLEGRVRDGVVQDHVVGPPVSGTVIEVGAGSGMWADVFAKIVRDGSEEDGDGGVRRRGGGKPGLTKIYGVEPNPQSAAALRRRVKDVGLDGIYEVVPVGIESLSDPHAWSGKTLEPGSIDCVVSIMCLCSIPDQADNIKALYKLLKPGGRWYVYEHVKVERGGILLSIYQRKSTHPRVPCLLLLKSPVCVNRNCECRLVHLHGLVPHVQIDGQEFAQCRALVRD